MARPILIAAERRPDGRLALTYSTVPGRRVTMVAGFDVLTEQLAAEIAAKVLPLLENYRQADSPPA